MGARRLAVRLLLASAALGLGLLCAEAVLPVLAPEPLGQAQPSPLLRGEFTAPGDHPLRTPEFQTTVHVNQQGFVDQEWAPAHMPRVVVIGDSFVQAAQVELEQGYGRVLQAELGRRCQAPVQVLSLGVPGAGTATALGLLEQYGLPLAPDLVLLGFLVANDVLNNHPLLEGKDDKPFYRLVGGALVPMEGGGSWDRSEGFFWRHSHIWRRWVRAQERRQTIRRKLALGAGIPLDLRVHDPTPDATWEQAWHVTAALLDAMAARCREAAVPFAIVLFPDAVQATDSGRQQAQQAWPITRDWDLEAANRRLAAITADTIPLFDLTPALRAADAQGQTLYFAQDGHWTAAGHRAAATATVEFAAQHLGASGCEPPEAAR